MRRAAWAALVLWPLAILEVVAPLVHTGESGATALASAVATLKHGKGRHWPPDPWRERFTARLARARRK